MSSAENGRLVFVTEGLLDLMPDELWHVLRARYEAASADPAEAVRLALYNGHDDPVHGSVEGDEHDVLAALGVPQRPTPRDETPT